MREIEKGEAKKDTEWEEGRKLGKQIEREREKERREGNRLTERDYFLNSLQTHSKTNQSHR